MDNSSFPLVSADEMNQANEELRDTIRSIWPLQAKKMLDLLIPRNEGELSFALLSLEEICTAMFSNAIFVVAELNKGKLTVGKIYVCLLILESWKTTRFGQIESAGQVSLPLSKIRIFFFVKIMRDLSHMFPLSFFEQNFETRSSRSISDWLLLWSLLH